jgi:hypothetical protein
MEYASYLGLDWKQTYLALLDDLKVRNIRLVAQWDEVQPEFDKFYFDDVDWMLTEADQRDVRVILAVGRRTPRWPECHDPVWVKDLPLEKAEKEQIRFVEQVVTHFKVHQSVAIWQVENEPFLRTFGKCPVMKPSLIKTEVAAVKSLDDRPVMVTDSGEMSDWVAASHLGDKFGYTLYRRVYNRYIGYFNHIFPPAYYYWKARMNNVPKEDLISVELQAEPWVPFNKDIRIDYKQFADQMTPEILRYNVIFATKTGASEIYLWGAEWWYFMKQHHAPQVWSDMTALFNQGR